MPAVSTYRFGSASWAARTEIDGKRYGASEETERLAVLELASVIEEPTGRAWAVVHLGGADGYALIPGRGLGDD